MTHGRDIVVSLQQAHADHIEYIYAGLRRIPGNPRRIEIDKIGQTRVFIANEDRMENRAILTGNETMQELELIAVRFEQRKRTCFVELNPANFLRTAPFSWTSEIMPALAGLGFRPDAFRCVWHLDEPLPEQADIASSCRIDVYASTDIARFILTVTSVEGARQPAEIEELSQGQASEEWLHYIGYEGGAAVSTSSLFIHNSIGYLKWGFTQQEHRNRGHQKAHIHRRIRDAFARGCKSVFSVTDFETASGSNLQKCGLKLAYNYVLMVRKPASSP